MPVNLCPLNYNFQDSENFYIFVNLIDFLQGILGFLFYLHFQKDFASGLLMVWYQVFFLLAASTIFSYYKHKKTFLTYPHFTYLIFKCLSLLTYFIIYGVNIMELDFNIKEKDKTKASIVSLLILAFFFNVFHFSWHLKLTKSWLSLFQVTNSYSPHKHEENLLIDNKKENNFERND